MNRGSFFHSKRCARFFRNCLLAGPALYVAFLSQATAQCAAPNPHPGSAETTPTSAFTDNHDGTVTHTLTGLMWKQCVEGSTGTDCSGGSASLLTWPEALLAAGLSTQGGHVDWRVPNAKEAYSIVEFCGTPPYNATIFPNTPGSEFWTSSSTFADPKYALVVNLTGPNNVGVRQKINGTTSLLRLVRGGRSLSSYDARTSLGCNMDVDGNGNLDALSDGVILLRALFGLTGTAVTANAVGANPTRPDWASIRAFLNGQCGMSLQP